MIIKLGSGGHVVVGEMLWLRSAYLAVGNTRSSGGAMVDDRALDQLIAELERVRDLIAEHKARQQRTTKRERKKAA